MQQIDDILNAVPMAMVLVSPDEKVRAANKLAVGLLGDVLVGRHYISMLRQPAILDLIETTLTKDEAGEAQYFATSQSTPMTYLVRVVPIHDDDGVSALVSFEDTTPLQQVGQMRRDFVANVSHELRTPLTALLGFIETLRGAAKNDPDARERFLTIMQNEAERMNRLVKDLLSLSRVEADERVRPTEKVNVFDVVSSANRSIKPITDAAQTSITIEADDKSHVVLGDQDQLTQVFSNLLENAVKYGAKPGHVKVTITKIDHEPMLRGPAIRIDVRDDGPGIDPVHIPRLAERFYRVDGHRSRELGGTGLGLAIVKHIINRHRGRMKISSELGQGTQISITLPTP